MSSEILTTKLFIPPTPRGIVHRQRLIDQLAMGLNGKLTLVSGPAGFGKTTLLSEWVSQIRYPIGWISLDKGDNELNRFVLYLIKAFQWIEEGFGNEIIESVISSKPKKTDGFLPFLINQIAEIDNPFLIIIDDYHLITAPEINELLLMIIENQSPQMHLVISTRSDPPWPLARWRAKGQLSEIRLGDLRFTLEETSRFLDGVLGIRLSKDDIQRLESRTEGWIAGLQMAAISMRKRGDISGFIQSFTGSHRFVFDYLLDEVFGSLPQDIQDFLLQTAILDRLCASLCDYVRNSNDSQQMLDLLEQMNLFLIPLDDHRSWYRYHHLFAELIQQLSRQKLSGGIPDLHRKAREWYQQNGLISEAIYHGTAEGNIDQVADLIEHNFLSVLDHRDWVSLTHWLDALPAAIIQSRPWLCVASAYVILDTENMTVVAQHIQQAEAAVKNSSQQDAAHIFSYIDFLKAELSARSGEMDKTVAFARKSLDGIPPQDARLRCLAASTLGTALQRIGNFSEAAKSFSEGISAGRTIRDSNAVMTLYGDLIGLYVERGQLHKAYEYCQEALQYIEIIFQKRGRYIPGAAYIHFRLSTILRHWGDLEGSLVQAQISDHILAKWGQRYILNFLNLAIALHAVGECSQAHQVLDEALALAKQQSSRMVENINATKVLFWLTEGNLDAAAEWAENRDLDTEGEIDYQDQLAYRTLAQVRLAQGKRGDRLALDGLLRFLPRLLEVVEESGAIAYLLQTLIIQSLAYTLTGSPAQAIRSLNRALILGERGGYIRVFVRAGKPIEKLLRSICEGGESTPYKQKILKAFDHQRSGNGQERIGHPPLPDQLTARELEVLTCLDSDLSVPEIAESLVISSATLRTHIKRIYRKLDVHSRFEATTKAKELRFL